MNLRLCQNWFLEPDFSRMKSAKECVVVNSDFKLNKAKLVDDLKYGALDRLKCLLSASIVVCVIR